LIVSGSRFRDRILNIVPTLCRFVVYLGRRYEALRQNYDCKPAISEYSIFSINTKGHSEKNSVNAANILI
jgi:hypothetical protein